MTVAVVTGANRGIGLAIARDLAAKGAGMVEPVLGAVLARVPLDQEADLLGLAAGSILQGVVAAVEAHQQGQAGEAPGIGQDAVEYKTKTQLPVLAARL